MAHHEAVSCDACMKSSFSGNRYKCLICYDYDLCANCYEAGATSGQHLTQHPMQCVLARADCDLYYAGEDSNKIQIPRSFTCPFCGRMGFSDATLNTHVSSEHADDAFEVICPVCAATPGGDPNRVTEDFIAHLMLEHRGSSRDFDEAQCVTVAAIATEHQPAHHTTGTGMRSLGRVHREAYQYHSPCSTISSLSPSGGQESETIESMSELLYQLSAIKGRSSTLQNLSSQLQQLELQLQTTRHQLEGLPFRQPQQAVSRQPQLGPGEGSRVIMLTHGVPLTTNVVGLPAEQNSVLKHDSSKQYLLSRLDNSPVRESEQEKAEMEGADKALFTQELLLTALIEGLASKDPIYKLENKPANVTENVVLNCNLPVLPSSGHQLKNSSDRKPVSQIHKETVTMEMISLAPGDTVMTNQGRDRMEMHPQKTRLHPPPKVPKHKSSKEPLPPKK